MCMVLNIPHYFQYNGEKKIALLDNTTVQFMQQLDDKGYHPDFLLKTYDVILLPQWVVEEIQDSDSRVQYIEKLVKEDIPIRIIKESYYSDLMDQEEIFLYDIVKAAVSKLGVFRKYLNINVETEDPLDMESYEEWIRKMYEDWPLSGELTANGRVKKKNAGEISLTILSEIFSWHYPNTELLTVYTQDSDSYEFQREAEEQLKKKDNYENKVPVSVTYRSNDSILCQMYRDNQLTVEEIRGIRNNERYVTYILTHEDKSVELATGRLDNETFVNLIQDESFQIIF